MLLGDARLTLERQVSQQFDVLTVDAFTGDAVPVHLLTREAFQLYFRHLKPTGILAVQVTNRYLNLVPVVARNALDLGKTAIEVYDDGKGADYLTLNRWILVSSVAGLFTDAHFRDATIKPAESRPGLRPWTDDYRN